MPTVILVFSTLLLDKNAQHPVVLPKQNLKTHLSPKLHQERNLPVFHFITIVQENVKYTSITIIDSPQEIQFGYYPPTENPPASGFAATIITLHQPPEQSEYHPYLVENTFENIMQLKEKVFTHGHLSTSPDPFLQNNWNLSQDIPVPLEMGNHFFPSFPFYNQDHPNNPFYDISPVPFRHANANIYNICPNQHLSSTNMILDNFAKCENSSVDRVVYYDEIISERIMNTIPASSLETIHQEYICCPFIFPAHCNLHHMIIHPDSIFIQHQQPNSTIFREHRSPVFNIISKLSIRNNKKNKVMALSPVCLYAIIQSKELFFSFKNQLSAIYEMTDHKEKYLTLSIRRPRKPLTPNLWASNSISFDYLISKMDPVRLNLDGTAESPTRFLQPRTVHIDRLRPTTTVAQLCTNFVPWTLGPIPSKEEPQSFPPAVTQDFHDTQENFENMELVNHDGPSRPTSSPIFLNSSQEPDLPDVDLLDSEFMFDESNPNLIPLGTSVEADIGKCLSDFLENEYHPKIQRPRPRTQPYSRKAKYPKFCFTKSLESRNSKLNTEVEECLEELDEFIKSLKSSPQDETQTSQIPSPAQTTTTIGIEGTDIAESSSPRENVETPENLQPPFKYNINELTLKEKTLFLFENELKDKTVTEQQVPKLLAKIKLGNEHGQFEEITALVDSGSDVTLITLNRLRSLVSQKFISDNIEKENAVLTSFTNTGIKIEGKLQLRFKLNDNGSVKTWKFLVISQNSVIDMIIGNDMLMHFCMSIQVKIKNKPEIILPDGEPVATFYARINEVNECQKDVKLKPKQKAYIKITPHPAFTAFRNERLLVEGAMDSVHIVVPLACKILPDGRLPLAVVNNSNKEILDKVKITVTRMAPDQRIIGHRDLKDIQVYTLMVPVQISNQNEGLEIQSAECTKEINVYKMDLQHVPPKSGFPQKRDLANKVKVPKRGTRFKTDGHPQQGTVFNSPDMMPPTSRFPQKDGLADAVKVPAEGTVPPTSRSPRKDGLADAVKVPTKGTGTKIDSPTKQKAILDSMNDAQKGAHSNEDSGEGLSDEKIFSPENFWKDMDGKFLPPGYEVFQNSTIDDIVKLSEYPPSIRKYIKDIFIDKYSDIISRNDYEIGQLSNTLGPIKLHLKPGTKLPPFRKLYYLESTQAQALRDILSYLLKEKIIEPCGVNDSTGFNGFSSPAYLVSKANPEKSAYRLIVNYKNLNQELLLTPPILPSINQYLQKLRRGYVFSQFDLSSAFYSLRLDKESQKLTMFSTCFGNFKFRSLAMGLATSPGAFCHIANDLIHTEPVRDKEGNPIFTATNMVKRISSPLDFACIYFDDVCIFSTLQSTYEETVRVHFDCVEKVMKRLHFHKTKLKWSKTELLRTEILFLGHKISNGKAYADPRRVDKLLNAKFPTSLNHLRSFLGLLNSLRSYLPPVISKNMTTLQELTSTKKGFHPKENHQQAFTNLKVSLTKEPLYTSIIDPAGHYYLFCDAASGEKASFSAVLTQVIRDRENEYPSFLNACDPIHHYIYTQDLRYRPIPLYLGSERICKTKVDRKTYDPIFIPSYYEKKNIGYTDSNLTRTWFLAIQSIYYDMNCKFLDEAEVRKEAVSLCRKGLLAHKIKSYCYGGHHVQAKQYLQDFQDGKANVDKFLFMMETIAEAIRRTIILITMSDTEAVSTRVLNANEKTELILGVYTVGDKQLFYPFKRVDADTLRVHDFQDRIQIVGFYSKSIPQGTNLLDIAQIEALGLLFTLDHYRPYIKMSKLTLITDNLVFFSILSKKVLDCSSLMARYALKILVSYPQCRIRHILTSNNLADFLTRENKIDKNTLMRLPLSAFTVDNELSRKIDQKKEYTFLEMRDFCDQNQQFIQVQTDVMGRKKVSVRKHDRVVEEQQKTLLSLTYDSQTENGYHDTEELIVNITDDQVEPYFFDTQDQLVITSDSEDLEEATTKNIQAVTRSKKAPTSPTAPDITSHRASATPQLGDQSKQDEVALKPMGQPIPEEGEKDQSQANKKTKKNNRSKVVRKSKRLEKKKLNNESQSNEKNILNDEKAIKENVTTEMKQRENKLLPENKNMASKKITRDKKVHAETEQKENDILADGQSELNTAIVSPTENIFKDSIQTEDTIDMPLPRDNVNEESQPSVSYKGDNITDSEVMKAEYDLDKITHPNPRINNAGDAIYPKVDPFRAQLSLMELMALKTSHPNLIASQKVEFQDIINECQQSTDFKTKRSRGTYYLKNSVLYYQETDNEEKIVLPSALHGFLIGATHIIKQHPGIKRMLNELAIYYIPGLTKLLTLYISSCFTCLLNNRQKSAQLGHVPIVRPGYCFHADLAEGLPSNSGYKHILLVVDPFTKLLLTYPLKEKTAAQVLPYLTHTVFQLFFVRILITDGGPCFQAAEFKKTMKDLYIVHKTVSAHHPQSNSHAESKVKRLKEMLRKMLSSESSTDWLVRLPLATKILNCCKLSEIPLSPLELLYGKDQENSQHMLTTPVLALEKPPYKTATEIQTHMKPVISKYRKIINERNVNRKKKINKNLRNPEVRVGCYVIIKDFGILQGINKTLHNIYRNEFYRVEQVKPRSVVAKSLTTNHSKLIAFSNIKVLNENNYSKLNIPPVIWKLLVKDARMLTQSEQLYIASQSEAYILPTPSEELISEYLSESENELSDEEQENRKQVTFDLTN